MVDYGVTDRLNVIADLPYVWTGASQGVLHGMSGLQDLTVAAKFNLLETEFTNSGVAAHDRRRGRGHADQRLHAGLLSALASAAPAAALSGRLTLSFHAKRGWFLDGSSAYTWRDNVTLDRAAYFTDDQLFFSDQVAMPDVFDYTLSAGYRRSRA